MHALSKAAVLRSESQRIYQFLTLQHSYLSEPRGDIRCGSCVPLKKLSQQNTVIEMSCFIVVNTILVKTVYTGLVLKSWFGTVRISISALLGLNMLILSDVKDFNDVIILFFCGGS